jgi:hypothetical protein
MHEYVQKQTNVAGEGGSAMEIGPPLIQPSMPAKSGALGWSAASADVTAIVPATKAPGAPRLNFRK